MAETERKAGREDSIKIIIPARTMTRREKRGLSQHHAGRKLKRHVAARRG